jgi:hypothetical protein
MNAFTVLTDEDLDRERIEMASHEHPFCAACGQPMTIAVHGRELWSECRSLRPLSGLRLRLASSLHDRQAIGGESLPARSQPR